MNFRDLLNCETIDARAKKAKVIANNISGKLIDVADKGLFRLELLLQNDTADHKAWNEVVISKEFTVMLEAELEGVYVTGELRKRASLLGIIDKDYYLIFEWD